MKNLNVISEKAVKVTPSGNWNTAKDYFPEIDVNQETGSIEIRYFDTEGHQKKASVMTHSCGCEASPDGQVVMVRGEVTVKNWMHYQCSGSQKFVFAIFVGDSGHIYVHRAPATKGWLTCKPESVLKRLRKLGIGAERVAYQQGDFLLKNANGNAYPDDQFVHETMGAGHHKFDAPVLYASRNGQRQYWIKESVTLTHEAVDGIQHPTLTVEPGKYIVGTTANGLHHSNKRD